jgi:hypothetical protein
VLTAGGDIERLYDAMELLYGWKLGSGLTR